MKWMITAAMLLAGAAQADVLGLTDYDAIFAAEGAVMQTLDDGSSVVALPENVQIMRSDRGITSVDAGPLGALGCFVNVLSNVAAFEVACGGLLDDADRARMDTMLDQIMPFYAANVVPPTTADIAREKFDALIVQEAATAANYCEMTDETRTFLRSVVSDNTAQMVQQMLAVPRFPASNPCL